MAGLKVWRVCSTKVRIVLLTCTFMKQVTYKLRGLDGHGHFCPILISFNRRAPNKYMAKFYISELKYMDKDIISNNLRNIWWLICWPASLFRYTFYTEFIHLTNTMLEILNLTLNYCNIGGIKYVIYWYELRQS